MIKLITILALFACTSACANNPFATGHYVPSVTRVEVKPFATVWYVSPTGNDATGNGSAGSPWATIYKASTSVTTAGDIIHLTAGTFTETQRSYIAAGVHVEGVDSNSTIVRGTMTAQFTEIIGFRSGTQGSAGNQSVSNIYFDGQSRTSSWALAVFARSDIEVFNCKFRDFDESAMYITGKDDFNPETEAGTYSARFNLHDCSIINCSKADATYGRGAVYLSSYKDVTITNCIIDQSSRSAGQNGYCIKLNNFTKNVEISYCQLIRDRFPYYTEGDNNHFGFSIESGDPKKLHVHHCTLTGNIDINRCNKGEYEYGALIEYCTFGNATLSGNQECGVWLEYSNSDITVRYCTFKNVTNALLFSNHFNHNLNKRIYFTNNLCYGSGRSGGSGDAYITTVTDGQNDNAMDSIFIDHNTFVGHPTYPNAQLISVSNNYDGVTNYFFTNNIAVAAGSDAPIISGSAAFINGFYHTNNTLYLNGNGNAAKWLSGTPTNYYVNNMLNTDPMLAGDYTLQAGSPAINTATDGTNRGHTGGTGGSPGPSGSGKQMKTLKGKKFY